MTSSTLVIFSGLPGTGKSSLANQLARELRWPWLCIDDVAVKVPEGADVRFWDEKVLALLTLAEAQLSIGLSVVVDSVFMGLDRIHAQELARQYQAAFRPVYCFVSDEVLWEQRVSARFDALQNPAVASWARIQHQREHFRPWEAGTALFVDAVQPLAHNLASVLEYVASQDVQLKPLTLPDEPLQKGSYHAN